MLDELLARGLAITEANPDHRTSPFIRLTPAGHEVLARICAESTPVGRAGAPEEIAAIAAFLSSDRNGFVTGDTIEASGGADRFL